MKGTHVLLCQDVDQDTRSTVVVKVAGDIAGGHVYREDGYLLELRSWGGDPRLLKGRHFIVGSVPGAQAYKHPITGLSPVGSPP